MWLSIYNSFLVLLQIWKSDRSRSFRDLLPLRSLLLTALQGLPRTVCNEFQNNRSRNLDYFFLLGQEEDTPIYKCSGLHRFVHNSGNDKKQISNVLPREKEVIPRYSFLLNRGLFSMLELSGMVILHCVTTWWHSRGDWPERHGGPPMQYFIWTISLRLDCWSKVLVKLQRARKKIVIEKKMIVLLAIQISKGCVLEVLWYEMSIWWLL